MGSEATRLMLRRLGAWSALLAICIGAAVPTLAQSFGIPRAALSEMCSSDSAASLRMTQPDSDAALLAHLFQHCADCVVQAAAADDAPLPTLAHTWPALAPVSAVPAQAAQATPAHAAHWPAPPSRAPPAPL